MSDINWDYLINMFDDGMIFVVDSTTFEAVVDSKLFGLPLSYLKEMKLLNPGRSALFFFERNAQTISGLFTPSAKAQANINTEIWKHRNGTCKFPAQIPWTSVHKMPTVAKNHPKLPRFIRNMKIKGKYLDCLRLRELLISFRNICGESPAVCNPYLADRRTERPARKRPSRNQKFGNPPDWESYQERRQEYENAMASYSGSQSSDADRQEYSRSPTWSWDYGDEDEANRLEDYQHAVENEDYERHFSTQHPRSKAPHFAPVSPNVYFKHGRGEPRRFNKGASYHRDYHHGGYSHRPQYAVDYQLTMDTADFMDYYMKGSAQAKETSSITEPAH